MLDRWLFKQVLISFAKSGAVVGTVVPLPPPPSAKVGVSSTRTSWHFAQPWCSPASCSHFPPSKRMKPFPLPRCAEAGPALRRLAAAWFLAALPGAPAPVNGKRRGTASIQFLQWNFLQRLVPWWYHGFHSVAWNRVLPHDETIALRGTALYREFHSARRSVWVPAGANPW
jgi:hypothetical protein